MIDGFHLEATVLKNPVVRAVWQGWHHLNLPDCWLVAGCLAQTVWNDRFGLQFGHGISDLDLVYFDPSDLSEASEQTHANRIRELFPELGVWIDVKNEARVHLWYQAKYGYPINPYRSTIDAIDTFPTTATAVGIRPSSHGAETYATFGLHDLCHCVVRPNKRQITREIFESKVARWLDHWPELTVIGWDE